MLYLHNAKSGCSTVRATLIREASRTGAFPQIPDGDLPPGVVHGPGPWWSKAAHLISRSTRSFTLVRNPFARILSAYLDKICRPNHIREQFLDSLGLARDSDISFEQFLDLIDPATQMLDEHWQPQVENVLWGAAPISRVFYLESFAESNEDLRRMLGLRTEFIVRQEHATGASSKLAEHLTPRAVDRIRSIYAGDFDAFGYSTDPDDAMQAPGLSSEGVPPDPVALRTVHLIGITATGAGDPRTARALWDTTQTYAQRIALMPWAKHLSPENLSEHVAETERLLVEGDRNQRHLAQRYVAFHAKRFDPDAVTSSLQSLLASAPYLLIVQARWVDHLIATGRLDEAHQRIGQLEHLAWTESAGWHDQTLPRLKKRLARAS